CCETPYGSEHFALELGCAAAAVLCVWLFGITGQSAFYFALLALVLVLTTIDMTSQLLPDVLLVPLLIIGVLFQVHYRAGFASAMIGMTLGYILMWCIGTTYRLATGKEGMGRGDIKMAGALGAWIGS